MNESCTSLLRDLGSRVPVISRLRFPVASALFILPVEVSHTHVPRTFGTVSVSLAKYRRVFCVFPRLFPYQRGNHGLLP